MNIPSTAFHTGERVKEEDLLPAEKGCPFCGSEKRDFLFPLQEEPDISLLRCETCKCSSASRIPTQHRLDVYYRNYYRISRGIHDDRKATFHYPRNLASHIFRGVHGYDVRRGTRGSRYETMKILDFGGGDGTLAVEM